MTCDRLWQVDAVRDGRLASKDAESFERHRRTCAACDERMNGYDRLRRLGDPIGREPSDLQLKRVRARVLRDAAVARPAPARARVALAIALAAGVLAIGIGVARRPWSRGAMTVSSSAVSSSAVSSSAVSSSAVSSSSGPQTAAPEAFAGDVVAEPGARWTQAREAGVERVRLDDGTVTVHVRPQRPGERFLVVLPDGELEVRGTTFTATVRDGATARVAVAEGAVEVRSPNGAVAARLGRGDAWSRPAAAANASPPPVRPEPRAPASPAAPADDGATAYAAAMALLRAGRADEASIAFHAFAIQHPRAPQAEDASFLEAVALARLGRVEAAGLAAQHHLAGYPRSFHRRDAAVLVARAASARGDCAQARATLASWIGDASDGDARAALGACPR
jgi:hypothetical protein